MLKGGRFKACYAVLPSGEKYEAHTVLYVLL